jgi:hypothetical protein
MWSLPDINRMNAKAESDQDKYQKILRTGKDGRTKVKCESEDEHCAGEVRLTPWYDIFSDDIKGINAACEYHDDHQGMAEGFFYCDGCNRVMIENYTWELYYAFTKDGEKLCLPCYAYEVLRDEDQWTPLTDERIESLTLDDLRKAPHCIGVKMPIPKQIRFINNVEFDSSTGQCISGGGVEELKETLRDLKSKGEKKAILILDAGYQFAVSIGVYALNQSTIDVKPKS